MLNLILHIRTKMINKILYHCIIWWWCCCVHQVDRYVIRIQRAHIYFVSPWPCLVVYIERYMLISATIRKWFFFKLWFPCSCLIIHTYRWHWSKVLNLTNMKYLEKLLWESHICFSLSRVTKGFSTMRLLALL